MHDSLWLLIIRLGHHIKLDFVLRELCISFLKTNTLTINYLHSGIITSRSEGSVTIIVGNATQSRYACAIKKGNNKVAPRLTRRTCTSTYTDRNVQNIHTIIHNVILCLKKMLKSIWLLIIRMHLKHNIRQGAAVVVIVW